MWITFDRLQLPACAVVHALGLGARMITGAVLFSRLNRCVVGKGGQLPPWFTPSLRGARLVDGWQVLIALILRELNSLLRSEREILIARGGEVRGRPLWKLQGLRWFVLRSV